MIGFVRMIFAKKIIIIFGNVGNLFNFAIRIDTFVIYPMFRYFLFITKLLKY